VLDTTNRLASHPRYERKSKGTLTGLFGSIEKHFFQTLQRLRGALLVLGLGAVLAGCTAGRLDAFMPGPDASIQSGVSLAQQDLRANARALQAEPFPAGRGASTGMSMGRVLSVLVAGNTPAQPVSGADEGESFEGLSGPALDLAIRVSERSPEGQTVRVFAKELSYRGARLERVVTLAQSLERVSDEDRAAVLAVQSAVDERIETYRDLVRYFAAREDVDAAVQTGLQKALTRYESAADELSRLAQPLQATGTAS